MTENTSNNAQLSIFVVNEECFTKTETGNGVSFRAKEDVFWYDADKSKVISSGQLLDVLQSVFQSLRAHTDHDVEVMRRLFAYWGDRCEGGEVHTAALQMLDDLITEANRLQKENEELKTKNL